MIPRQFRQFHRLAKTLGLSAPALVGTFRRAGVPSTEVFSVDRALATDLVRLERAPIKSPDEASTEDAEGFEDPCAHCNHTRELHDPESGHCYERGCGCKQFKEPSETRGPEKNAPPEATTANFERYAFQAGDPKSGTSDARAAEFAPIDSKVRAAIFTREFGATKKTTAPAKVASAFDRYRFQSGK